MANKVIKILRNESLLSSYDAAYSKLTETLSTLTDGEIAYASYGDSWASAKTIIGIVRVNGGTIATTIYEPFKTSDVQIGDGLTFDTDGSTIIANIDGDTLVFDSGVIKVDGEKLTLKINSSDSVITQDATNGIMANISLTYDSSASEIKLVGKNDTVISTIDATDFVKDGMLSDAELVTTAESGVTTTVPYIKLTFNTDADNKVIRFSVKDLVDTYTAGNGLSLSSNTFSLKLSTESDDEGYLSVSSNGLKISGIDEKISALDDRITEIEEDNVIDGGTY